MWNGSGQSLTKGLDDDFRPKATLPLVLSMLWGHRGQIHIQEQWGHEISEL